MTYKLPELPTPTFHVPQAKLNTVYGGQQDNRRPDFSLFARLQQPVPAYTAGQFTEFATKVAEAARREALEEAAQKAAELMKDWYGYEDAAAEELAAAIRSLMEEK